MKNIFFFVSILLVHSLIVSVSNAQVCTIAKTVSKNQKGDSLYGNAFAISNKKLIINEHSLTEDSEFVDLETNFGEKLKAKVLNKDFHTDLAVLEILNQSRLRPCTLASSQNLPQQQVIDIEGFDGGNQNTNKLKAMVTQARSARIQIPGIKTGIEMNGLQGNAVSIRKSMSGSPVLINGAVIGMVAQVTEDGAALAITSEKLQEFIFQAENNLLPKRRYFYKRSENTFTFDGLELNGARQVIKKKDLLQNGNPHEGMGGNPHEGKGGTPHEGMGGVFSPKDRNTNVALKDLDLGYAVAVVRNMNLLFANQPHIAELIQGTNAKVIYIKSLDGIQVRNLFQLIRALGECQKCRIDSFYVESDQASALSNQYLQGLAVLSKLLDSMSETKKPILIQSILPAFDLVNTNLNQLAEELSTVGGISSATYNQLTENWDLLESKIQNAYFTDTEQDLLMELRGIILEKPRMK